MAILQSWQVADIPGAGPADGYFPIPAPWSFSLKIQREEKADQPPIQDETTEHTSVVCVTRWHWTPESQGLFQLDFIPSYPFPNCQVLPFLPPTQGTFPS